MEIVIILLLGTYVRREYRIWSYLSKLIHVYLLGLFRIYEFDYY